MPTSEYQITNHAWRRMTARSITKENIETVLQWGRIVYTRGAKVYALGKKEIAKIWKVTSKKLTSLEGIQVVCRPNENVIVTVYKNKDFKSSLKENKGYGYHNLRNKSI